MSDLDDIRARLETIADELAEKALDVLREAVEKGETGRPAEERRLTRARAAVERAMGILADAPSDDL
jgi:ABC-type phosphate/phosphonate transport system ATPase subunit